MSSMQWANAPTTKAANNKTQMTQEEFKQYLQESISKLEKKLEDNPEDIETLLELAGLQMYNGKSDKTVESYQKVIDLDPKNTDALFNLMSISFNNKEYGKAEERAKKLLELEPENLSTKMDLATIYYYQNKFDEAEVLVKDVLKGKEDSQNAHRLYAYLLADGKQEYQKAVEEMDKFIELAKEGALVEDAKTKRDEWKEKIKE
ncbi:MAG: tetratricopeptide repeat protein [Firmicutes bacterium]|nr:tetratricopeptide repeat protein [Bacillota bacterium]